MEPEKSIIFKKMIFLWTVLDNCKSCLRSFTKQTAPADRKRFREPCDIPDFERRNEDPTGKDLGLLLKEWAIVTADYARHTVLVSDELIKEQEDTAEDLQRKRDRIQHIMDCTRYMSAFNQIMANIVIPMSSPPSARVLKYNPNPKKMTKKSPKDV